ncbi:PASTA domain-containing protein [Blattabacterium sp. (Cryptocercus kyebangensis)]|uniref:PASTA domain-containing protein n=1 Tax=Blattabacterium sp. (Cryptocercus kyebangensis) TaxID=298656 RepID=UPI000D7C42C9|nr:PASTA domain-containing protein [Blattabacterium sp. (Cryptocercus kyebangensis)]AWU43583.1 PASTA domain-containing protein [Blattabacterium sp. (Cryptocercus kyebangensis)]
MKYSKYFLILVLNLLISILILYKIINFALKWVNFYTKHGSYVKVPDLHHLTLNQSLSILNKLGLKYDVDTSRYDPYFDPFQVISFFPEAGDHVKKGRSIYIQANPKNYQSTVLPNIINQHKHIAIKLIHANHLLVKNIKYIKDLSKDIVLKVFYKGKSIPSGYILPHKDKITLIVGKGYEKNNFIIPNVIGMSFSSANYTLKEKSFNIINFYYDQSLEDHSINNAKVYRQEPYPGKIKDKNQPITLWLTSNNSKELFDDFIQKYESNPSKNINRKNALKKWIHPNKRIRGIERINEHKKI